MSNLTVRIIATLIALCGALAFGQRDAMAQGGDEATVMVLKFDTFNVDSKVTDVFYRSLNEGLEAHKGKRVVPGGEVSVSEMLLTAGCDDLAECAPQLAEVLEVDQLVYGSIQRSEDIYLFTIKVFDLRKGRPEASLEDQTVQGDLKRVREVVPTLVDALLYGDVGSVRVDISGAEGVDLLLDGEKVGKGPTVLEDLPLGEHVLTARHSNGEEQSQRVLLKRGEVARVGFSFGGVADTTSKGGGKKGLLIPGVGVAALGVAGVGFGTQQYLGYRRAGMWAEQNIVGCGEDGCALRDESLRDEYNANYSDVTKASLDARRTRSIIGWSAGGALLVAGGVLIAMSRGGSVEESAPDTSSEEASVKPLHKRVTFQVSTAPGYRGVLMEGRF